MCVIDFALEISPSDEQTIQSGGYWSDVAGDHPFGGWPDQRATVTIPTMDLSDLPGPMQGLLQAMKVPDSPKAQSRFIEGIYTDLIEPPRRHRFPREWRRKTGRPTISDASCFDEASQLLQAYGQWLLGKVLLGAPGATGAFCEAWNATSESRGVLRILIKFVPLANDRERGSRACETFRHLTYELSHLAAIPELRLATYHLLSANVANLGYRVTMWRVPCVDRGADGDGRFFDAASITRRCHPRVFAGIASTDEGPIPGWYDRMLQQLGDRLNGETVLFLSAQHFHTLTGVQKSRQIVIVVCHGGWEAGQYMLLLVDPDTCIGAANWPAADLGHVLHRWQTRLAVLVCCEPREQLFDVETLFHPGGDLAAVISFRASVRMQSAYRYFETFAEHCAPGNSLDLVRATQEASWKMSATFRGSPNIEFSVPQVHVRADPALRFAHPNGWICVPRDLREAAFSGELIEKLRGLGLDRHGQPLSPADLALALSVVDGLDAEGYRYCMNPAVEVEVGRYPITNGEYLRYFQILGHRQVRTLNPSAEWLWFLEHGMPEEDEHLPATNISLAEIWAYGDWCAIQAPHGYRYRLPNHDEWIVITYLQSASLFPWGNQWRGDFWIKPNRLAPVQELWANALGLYVGVGNAREVTHFYSGAYEVRFNGGGFRSQPWECSALAVPQPKRVAKTEKLGDDVGFRLVRERTG